MSSGSQTRQLEKSPIKSVFSIVTGGYQVFFKCADLFLDHFQMGKNPSAEASATMYRRSVVMPSRQPSVYPKRRDDTCTYHLVMTNIAMENHHFSWVYIHYFYGDFP